AATSRSPASASAGQNRRSPQQNCSTRISDQRGERVPILPPLRHPSQCPSQPLRRVSGVRHPVRHPPLNPLPINEKLLMHHDNAIRQGHLEQLASHPN